MSMNMHTQRTDEILIYWKVNNRRMPSCHTHKCRSQQQYIPFVSHRFRSEHAYIVETVCIFAMLFLSHRPIDDRSVYNLLNKYYRKWTQLIVLLLRLGRWFYRHHTHIIEFGTLSLAKSVCTQFKLWRKKRITLNSAHLHRKSSSFTCVRCAASIFFVHLACRWARFADFDIVYVCIFIELKMFFCMFVMVFNHTCGRMCWCMRVIFWHDDESTPHKMRAYK